MEIKTQKCPYAKKCGGCQMDGRSYQDYLAEKERWINELLAKEAKNLFDGRIHLTGMQDPYHYRYKCNAAFGWKKDGTVLAGSYMEKTHQICDRDDCLIENKKADEIVVEVKKLLPSFKIKVYNEDTGYGWFRHTMVRVSRATGKVMLILVAVDSVFPSKNNFVKALLKKFPEMETVILNVNEKQTNMVLGDRNITLYGPGFIEDTLCGLKFRISPGDFFQVNPVMTEQIYETAKKFAKLKSTDTILDAYCGIGTIGLTAASKVANVIGVELNKDAIRDAKKNAQRNKINNARFFAGDAGDFITELAGDEETPLDVVFLDPPRSGTTEEFVKAIQVKKPSRVVYVSCNPETLSRDLTLFHKIGYVTKQMQAFDQFPFTGHAEVVTSLVLK